MMGREVIDKDYENKLIKIAFNPFDEVFEVQNSSILKDPIWVSNITDVFQGDIFNFMSDYFKRLEDKMPDLDEDEKVRIRNNINSLTSLTSYQFSSIELSHTLSMEEISEIFVRINSQGKELNKSDFIFTLMSIYWPNGKNLLESFSKEAKIPSITSNSSFNVINAQPTNENLLRTMISYSFLRGRLKYAYLILKNKNDTIEKMEHKEFLAQPDDKELIRHFTESLINNIRDDGSVIVYNKSMEKTNVNQELIRMYPDLQEALEMINSNIVDFMIPFRNQYYKNNRQGLYSIKYLLPTLYPDNPELNYEKLSLVHQGQEASEIFLSMRNKTPEQQEKIRKGLLEYCKLDTYALVKIYEKFK